MDQKAYISERVDDQITWYEKRSGDYQKQYKRFRITEILCASSIPFLTGFAGGAPFLHYIIGLMGVIIAVVSAMDALIRPQELWTEYRTTVEKLKQEKFLFETGTAPYDGKDAFPLFVENVEATISKENARWYQNQKKQEEERREAREREREKQQRQGATPAASPQPRTQKPPQKPVV